MLPRPSAGFRFGVVAFVVVAALGFAAAGSFEQPVPSASPQPTQNPRSFERDGAAIRWLVVEIDLTCRQIVIQPDRFPQIRAQLDSALDKMIKLGPGTLAKCRWPCPVGDCGPDCQGVLGLIRPRVVPEALRDATSPDRQTLALGWYRSALENVSVDALIENPAQFSAIRQILVQALNSLLKIK
jgi:hypothetical protein